MRVIISLTSPFDSKTGRARKGGRLTNVSRFDNKCSRSTESRCNPPQFPKRKYALIINLIGPDSFFLTRAR
jgi:hypothetical protein